MFKIDLYYIIFTKLHCLKKFFLLNKSLQHYAEHYKLLRFTTTLIIKLLLTTEAQEVGRFIVQYFNYQHMVQ